MDIDTAIKCADAALSAELGRHLRAPEVTILQGAWARMTYEEIAETSKYSLNYLKRDVGPKFWKALSGIFGEEINKSNVHGALARRGSPTFVEQLPQQPLPVSAMETGNPVFDGQYAPSVGQLIGRQAELNTLRHWILEEQCSLIAVQGMAGTGKTMLVRQLTETVKSKFRYVFWRSHHQDLSLRQLMADLLQILPSTSVFKQDSPVSLVNLLQTLPCLLILDGAEHLLASGQLAGQYGEKYGDYPDFLQQVGQTQHHSCVLITTQELPLQLAPLLGQNSQVRSLTLEGLPEADAETLLAAKGLMDQSAWPRLIQRYQGNPAALGIVATWIQTVFNGHVAQFLEHEAVVLREIDDLLSPCFQRLTSQEQSILYELGLAEAPLDLADLAKREAIQTSPAALLDLLASLKARSLLTTHSTNQQLTFSLPPLVRAYILDQLRTQIGGRQPGGRTGQERLWTSSPADLSPPLPSAELTLSPIKDRPTHLNQWLQGQIDPRWQSLDILWQNQSELMPRLRSLAPLRDETAVKRVQRLHLNTKTAEHGIDWVVMVAPKGTQRLRIQIQVQPSDAGQCLPANLTLSLLNDAGECLSDIQTQAQDDCLRLPAFSGELNESFKICLVVDDQEIIEEFIL